MVKKRGKFTIRKYDQQKGYDILKDWFDAYKWSYWDPAAIPPASYFIFYKGVPVAFSGYFWGFNTNFGVLSFTISNPSEGALLRRQALDTLLDFVIEDATSFGISYLYYTTHDTSKKMIPFLEGKGFKTVEEGKGWISVFSTKNMDFLKE